MKVWYGSIGEGSQTEKNRKRESERERKRLEGKRGKETERGRQ